MNNQKRCAFILIIIFVSAATLSGCAQPPVEQPVKKAGTQRVEFADKEGELIVEEGGKSLPAAFPASMPIFEPSVIKGSVTSTGVDEFPMSMVILKTNKSFKKVADFYKAKLPKVGWQMSSSAVNEGGKVLLAVSKANHDGSITIKKEKNGATVISINVTARDK